MIQRYILPFIRWWIGQLAGLIPVRLLQAYAEAADAAILEITGDRFVLDVRRKGVLTRAGKGALRDLKAVMNAVADLPQQRLLRIQAPLALRKSLSLPLAVRRDLKTVLGFEIDRETPFEQDEIYWDYQIAGQDAARNRLDIELVLLPRRAGDPKIEQARAAGFIPAALEIARDKGPPTLLRLAGSSLIRTPALPWRNRPLIATVCALAVAVIGTPFAIQQLQFYLADRAIARYETQARAASALNQAANRRMGALQLLGAGHTTEGGALEILLAATRAVPDDTFLSAISVHEGQVTMSGSSEAAARLIGALARSPAFRDPVFDSALTEDDGGLERFSISAKLADRS
jgi:general secretion pathway protein L